MRRLCLGSHWDLQLINVTTDKMLLMVTVEIGHGASPLYFRLLALSLLEASL